MNKPTGHRAQASFHCPQTVLSDLLRLSALSSPSYAVFGARMHARVLSLLAIETNINVVFAGAMLFPSLRMISGPLGQHV